MQSNKENILIKILNLPNSNDLAALHTSITNYMATIE